MCTEKNLVPQYLSALVPSKKAAFTLAEVLITLAIIGIVAAMTMPNLIANYKKQVIASKLKQAYSLIKQAYARAEVDYGSIDNWEEFDIPPGGSDAANRDAAIEKYLLPYLDVISWKETPRKLMFNQLGGKYYSAVGGYITTLTLKNGMIIHVNRPYNEPNNFVWMPIYIDLNGEKGPQELGKDVFVMVYCRVLRKNCLYIRKNTSGVYLMGEGNTAEVLKTLHMYGCEYATADGPTVGAACGAWIMLNNWKIPDDYPW